MALGNHVDRCTQTRVHSCYLHIQGLAGVLSPAESTDTSQSAIFSSLLMEDGIVWEQPAQQSKQQPE